MTPAPNEPLLRLLGPPALGDELFVPERPHQLLALLACRRGWMPRDAVAELLWPERGPQRARSNLRKVLQAARRVALGAGMALDEQGDRLRWQPDSDLQRFEEALANGQVDAALALYRGPLLHGLDDGLPAEAEAWLTFERQRVAAAWRRAATARLDGLRDRPETAAMLAEAVLAQEPLDEPALLALVRSHAARGGRAEACRVLDEWCTRLRDTLGVEPAAAVRALSAELRATDGLVTAAGKPAAAPAALVGRRLELAQLVALAGQPEGRTLTILGPGGVGKSRLARAALRPLACASGSVGVHWIDLTDLDDAVQVPARLATALGADLTIGTEPWQQIAAHIGLRADLLVLDNAEHLPGLPARLEALLAACARLKLVVTSRSRLGLQGEWLVPLEGLPLPDADETDADILRACDAVRLFDERARAAHAGFDLATQAGDVVALLHAIDGLPLAIELAAAWVRLLPVREIVAELTQSPDLLASRDAAAGPAREHSLRASFAHSWRLIGVAEREALARLALLAGPFGREMAQQVADCGLPLLAALVDKSLVQAAAGQPGAKPADGGFWLHPVVRQCAAEEAEAGACDAAALRARHAAYMTRWIERVEQRRPHDNGAAMRDVEQSLAHVRAAWAWSLAAREPAFVAAAAPLLMLYWPHAGALTDGLAAMEQAVAVFDPRTTVGARAVSAAALGAGHLHFRAGRYADAEAPARLAVRLGTRGRDKLVVVRALNLLGAAVMGRGGYAAARPVIERALALARRGALPVEAGILLAQLARIEKGLGRYDEAAALMAEALAQARDGAHPNPEGVVLQTNNLGNLHAALGRWARALPYFEQALAEGEARGIAVHRALILMNMARARLALGETRAALATGAQALTLARAQGRQAIALQVVLLVQARGALALGDGAGARERIAEALAMARAAGLAADVARCVGVYAEVLAAEGDATVAAGLWQWCAQEPALPADDRLDLNRRLTALALDAAALALAAASIDVGRDGLAGWVAARCAARATDDETLAKRALA